MRVAAGHVRSRGVLLAGSPLHSNPAPSHTPSHPISSHRSIRLRSTAVCQNTPPQLGSRETILPPLHVPTGSSRSQRVLATCLLENPPLGFSDPIPNSFAGGVGKFPYYVPHASVDRARAGAPLTTSGCISTVDHPGAAYAWLCRDAHDTCQGGCYSRGNEVASKV